MCSLRRMSAPQRAGEAQGPSMFPHTVTIYNVSLEQDKTTLEDRLTNHITILRGVLLAASKAVNVQKSGQEGADAVQLYIPFSVSAADGVTGAEKRYVPPLTFWKAEDKSGLWTLALSSKVPGVDGNTFFIKGEAVEPDQPVGTIELRYDHVYDITKVDEFDFGSPDMMLWQVGGV